MNVNNINVGNVKLSRGIFILLTISCLYGFAFVDRVSAEVVYTSNASGIEDLYEGQQTLEGVPSGTEISSITIKVHIPPVAPEDPGDIDGYVGLGLDLSTGFHDSDNSYFLAHDGTDQYLDLVFNFSPPVITAGGAFDFFTPYGNSGIDGNQFNELYIVGSVVDTFPLGSWVGEEYNGLMADIYFIIEDSVVPAGPAPFVPLTFSIFPTSTESADLIASVAGGVQETGKAIWPMFAFVGVSLAFVIALQVVVFTKRAVTGKGGGVPTSGPYGPGGKHHRAFKRGRKLNKEDGIDLFPDD